MQSAFDCFVSQIYFKFIENFIKNFKNDADLKLVNIMDEISHFGSSWTTEQSEHDLLDYLEAKFHKSAQTPIFTRLQWSCVKCTFLNDPDLNTCAMCMNPKGFEFKNIIFY